MRVLKPISEKNYSPRILEPQVNETARVPYQATGGYRKIALPTLEGIHFEKLNDIVSLEAKGNYTCLYFKAGRQILISKTLLDLEKMLQADRQFIRIHRSFTINLNYLQKYIKGKGGIVEMEGGAHFNVSSGKKQDFLDALNQYFGCNM